jgi:hypothetical protein
VENNISNAVSNINNNINDIISNINAISSVDTTKDFIDSNSINSINSLSMKPARYPSSLSPSALKFWEAQPNKFFLERMAENPQEPEPQSIAAAVGSAFDFECKMFLMPGIANKLANVDNIYFVNKKVSILKAMHSEEQREYYKDKSLEFILWNTNIQPHNRTEAAGAGKYLFSIYKHILESECNNFVDVEIRRTFNLNVKGVIIPIGGIADAWYSLAVRDNNISGGFETVPFDWKVSGYNSEMSPKKGYKFSWSNGLFAGTHKDYHSDMPMDEIDEDWAMQCCTYGWMMGKTLFEPFTAMIDGIFIRKNTVKVARYVGVITPEYQVTVMDRYLRAWEEIHAVNNNINDVNSTGSAINNRVSVNRHLSEINSSNERWWG